MLGSAESSRETRLLDHRRETPLRLAAAPLARHFYCRDPRAINQPVVGPSARLLPFTAAPIPRRPSRSGPSPPPHTNTHTHDPSFPTPQGRSRLDNIRICRRRASADVEEGTTSRELQSVRRSHVSARLPQITRRRREFTAATFPVFPRMTHVPLKTLAHTYTHRHTRSPAQEKPKRTREKFQHLKTKSDDL